VRVVAFFCFFFWPNKKRKIESNGLNFGNYFHMKIIISDSSDYDISIFELQVTNYDFPKKKPFSDREDYGILAVVLRYFYP